MSEKKNLTYDFKDGFRFVSDMKKDLFSIFSYKFAA